MRPSKSTEPLPKDLNHWRIVKTLSKHLWPHGRSDLKIRVFLSVIALILAKIIGVVVPFFFKYTVDALSLEKEPLFWPLMFIAIYGALKIFSQFFSELRDYLFINVSGYAQRTLALDVFKHLHALSLEYHLDRQTGGLSRIIERGVRGIQFVLSFILFNILPTLFELVLITVILTYNFNYKFALAAFGTIAIYVAFSLIVTEWRIQFRRRLNEADTQAHSKAIDSLLNYETVKYFGNEAYEHAAYDKGLAAYERAHIASQASLSLLNVGQQFIIGCGLIMIMMMAAYGIKEGTLTVGDIVLVNSFLIQLYMPLSFLGFVYREIKHSLVDMDKMFQILDENAQIQDKENALPIVHPKGEIVFDAVRFSYRPDREILKGISFAIPQGKKCAIVGATGSGKSTITKLLFRFYDPSQGKITFDGKDIRDLTQTSLRSEIAVVPQDTVLFNDTIGYNIHYGNPEASFEQVIEAAKHARLYDFVSHLKEGFETPVGERGLKLSGGEKQRVSIARAILKNPAVMVFDEATSSLDSHTEKEIQKSLEEVSKNKTTLMIAHRLSTVIHADEILVIQAGEIVERGTHSQLLQNKGVYAAMWKKQQEEEH